MDKLLDTFFISLWLPIFKGLFGTQYVYTTQKYTMHGNASFHTLETRL